MLRIRRHDLPPRVELLPLIDIIFLLLTFFIYSMVVMVQAEVLPVQLVGVGTGEAAEPGNVQAITIDQTGQLYLNREPVDPDALDQHLHGMAGLDDPPRLFLAMEQAPADETDDAEPLPAVDRGPLLVSLIQRVREAGIEDFSIVGRPADQPEP